MTRPVSGGLQNITGRVESGLEVFKIARAGQDRPDPTRPARFDLTREQPCKILVLFVPGVSKRCDRTAVAGTAMPISSELFQNT